MNLDGYKKRSFLTITELEYAARCMRLYFYACGCGLREVSEHPALQFGEAIHAALPVTASQGVGAGKDAFTKAWDKNGDDKRNATSAGGMIESFHQQFGAEKSIYKMLPPPTNKLLVSDKINEWEIPYAVDIGLPIPLCGRIDGWVQHRDTGKKWAIEYKTTSQMGQMFNSGFDLHPQVIGYPTILRMMCPDEEIVGTVVVALKVQVGAKFETMTLPKHVQPHHSEYFLSWAQRWGRRILEAEQLSDWPQEISGCSPYAMFGQPGFQCKFMKLCQPPEWTMLKDMYKVQFHEPYVLPTVKGEEIEYNGLKLSLCPLCGQDSHGPEIDCPNKTKIEATQS